MSRQNFETCYIEMRVAVDFAAESLACWEVASQDQLKEWQQLPALQSYLARASFLTLIVELYKVLDHRHDTYSLYRLVEYAHAETIIPDPDAWRDIINRKLKPDWENKIKPLRHKFYAHLDDTKSPKQLIMEQNITPKDFRVLLDGYDSFLAEMDARLGKRPTTIKVKEDLIRGEMQKILTAFNS